jgi:hypothetical protein
MMEMRYSAYGLQLESSFALPGVDPSIEAGGDLPTLTLSLCAPSELELSWSGPSGPELWRGRQGDGRDLAIEEGVAGDLLFTYTDPAGALDRARFRMDAEMRQLDCAPRKTSLDWQRILIGKVLPSIAVMRGYEALHAGAVESPLGVVAIMGPSGMGKSTLASELIRRGWPLFCDDSLVLERVGETVIAHPGTPHMNVAADTDISSLGTSLGVLAGEHWLAADATAKTTRGVRMLCLFERGPGRPLAMQTLSPNPLLLAPYMLGLAMDPERQRSRFSLYGDLMLSATLVRLTAGPAHRPEQLADLIEQAMVQHPGPLEVGVQ